jgi:hypothetical protein
LLVSKHIIRFLSHQTLWEWEALSIKKETRKLPFWTLFRYRFVWQRTAVLREVPHLAVFRISGFETLRELWSLRTAIPPTSFRFL